jgi:hypothetical protein
MKLYTGKYSETYHTKHMLSCDVRECWDLLEPEKNSPNRYANISCYFAHVSYRVIHHYSISAHAGIWYGRQARPYI